MQRIWRKRRFLPIYKGIARIFFNYFHFRNILYSISGEKAKKEKSTIVACDWGFDGARISISMHHSAPKSGFLAVKKANLNYLPRQNIIFYIKSGIFSKKIWLFCKIILQKLKSYCIIVKYQIFYLYCKKNIDMLKL